MHAVSCRFCCRSLAARTNTARDAIRLTAFGGGWDPIATFSAAEYTLGLSDFTTDPPSIIPAPTNVIRAVHSSFPVAITIGRNTNKSSNRAPWGLGANFVEFIPAGVSGALTLTFEGTNGFAWRALAVATLAKGNGAPSVIPITPDGEAQAACRLRASGHAGRK